MWEDNGYDKADAYEERCCVACKNRGLSSQRK